MKSKAECGGRFWTKRDYSGGIVLLKTSYQTDLETRVELVPLRLYSKRCMHMVCEFPNARIREFRR